MTAPPPMSELAQDRWVEEHEAELAAIADRFDMAPIEADVLAYAVLRGLSDYEILTRDLGYVVRRVPISEEMLADVRGLTAGLVR